MKLTTGVAMQAKNEQELHAEIASLCERRARRVNPQTTISEQALETSQRSVIGYVGSAASACAAIAFLVLLWPLAKLAGAFDFSDAEAD